MQVKAARTSHGGLATTVSVEVNPEAVGRDLGEPARVEEVVAAVPVMTDGAVRWTESHLDKVGEEQGATGAPVKQTFATTHYGCSEAQQLGVRVKLRTTAGTVLTRFGASAGHGVRQEDQPEVAPPSGAPSPPPRRRR